MHTPRDIALRFLTHVERTELDDAMKLCTLDAQIWVPGHPSFTPAQLHDFLSLSFERLVARSFTLKPMGTTAEGERVAVEAHSSALFKDGKQYRNRYHFLFVVRDGRIRSLDVYAAGDIVVTSAWDAASAPKARADAGEFDAPGRTRLIAR